ncbi:MAG: hypothetical protein ACJ0QA_02225 [Flavobacteriaceae bacterium]
MRIYYLLPFIAISFLALAQEIPPIQQFKSEISFAGNQNWMISQDNKQLISLSNSNRAPFDNPHYILLNLAMGGNLGGDIPQNFNKGQMEIDYVRVYQ